MLLTESETGIVGRILYRTAYDPTRDKLVAEIEAFKGRTDMKGLRYKTTGKSRPVVISRIVNDRDFNYYARKEDHGFPNALRVAPSNGKPVYFETVQDASIALGLGKATLARTFSLARKKEASGITPSVVVRGLEVGYADSRETGGGL